MLSATTPAWSNCWCSSHRVRDRAGRTHASSGCTPSCCSPAISYPPPPLARQKVFFLHQVAVSGRYQPQICRREPIARFPRMPGASPGGRNIPCVDVPGKRAATPRRRCRNGTSTFRWVPTRRFGDRTDSHLPGTWSAAISQVKTRVGVIPALDQHRFESGARRSGAKTPPLTVARPGSGTVQCNGQQPNRASHSNIRYVGGL